MAFPASQTVFRPASNVPQTPPVTQPAPIDTTTPKTPWLGILVAVGILAVVVWRGSM